MPELPEVETVRRGLERHLLGARITSAVIHDCRLVRPFEPVSVEQAITGQRVTAVDRRGKYLIIRFEESIALEVHLRMTGSFAAYEPGAASQFGHVRATIQLDTGVRVEYNDPRRFGTFVVDEAETIMDTLNRKLGPEPLTNDFDAHVLRRALMRRSTSIKAALLDQRVAAGLGNIYVDEALLLSGIHPMRTAASIRVYELERLVPHVKERLETAIAAGGSTLRDYRGVEGADGTMQERFMAYGRAGLPCRVCGTSMQSARIAGRGTTWCPECQPRSGPGSAH